MKDILSKQEVDLLRSQVRGCSAVVHFNNAGASLPPDIVVDTVIDYLREEALYGGYETEAKHIGGINAVYDAVARLLNADREEIAVFENASAAWQTAFRGLPFGEGDEIITSEMEYVSNLIGLVDMQRKDGVKVKVVPNDHLGNFSLDRLVELIGPRTKLIAVTHISSSGGSVLPVEEIGKIAEKHGILYMVDACQSAGQLPLDVKKIKCDILSATGRKYLRAPRGTGFLFVKKGIQCRLKPTLMDFVAAGNVSLEGYELRQDARRFELYEKSRALTLGLGEAVRYAMAIGLDRIWNRIQELSLLTRKLLAEIPGIEVHDSGSILSGIITFSIEGMDSLAVRDTLAQLQINVSVGGAQATPIYMERKQLLKVVRVSVHYYNSEEEITLLCRELDMLVRAVKVLDV